MPIKASAQSALERRYLDPVIVPYEEQKKKSADKMPPNAKDNTNGGATQERSTAILHSTNNAHKEELLTKLGGSQILHNAVDEFYTRQVKDSRLAIFFKHANLAILKWHQFNMMSIAFSHTPETLDIDDFILTRHEKLFDAGLNETHFDVVMEHFEATFNGLNIDPKIVDGARAVVAPLRETFARGAFEAEMRVKQAERRQTLFWMTSVAAVAAIAGFLFHRMNNKK